MKKRSDTDHCSTCGSENLWSGYFDADDLACDGFNATPGTRWTTFCDGCRTEQT